MVLTAAEASPTARRIASDVVVRLKCHTHSLGLSRSLADRFLLLESYQVQYKGEKVAFLRYFLPVARSSAFFVVGPNGVLKVIRERCRGNPVQFQLGPEIVRTQIADFFFHRCPTGDVHPASSPLGAHSVQSLNKRRAVMGLCAARG